MSAHHRRAAAKRRDSAVEIRRCAIDSSPATQPAAGFAHAYVTEDAVLENARARATEVGVGAIVPMVGATLRLLAATATARTVVEVGTGTGVSGIWLLYGMRADGILTTIDTEPEHQRLARRGYLDAGVSPSRTRIITGRAVDVLPRLADNSYDLVFVDADRVQYRQYAESALRLLRSGGLLVFNNALGDGRIADPAARDPEAVALRDVARILRESDDWAPTLLPIGDGLLCAVKRGDAE